MFSGRFPTHKWRVSRTILLNNIFYYFAKAIRSLLRKKTVIQKHIFVKLSNPQVKQIDSVFYLQRLLGEAAVVLYKNTSDWFILRLLFFWPIVSFALFLDIEVFISLHANTRLFTLPRQWILETGSVNGKFNFYFLHVFLLTSIYVYYRKIFTVGQNFLHFLGQFKWVIPLTPQSPPWEQFKYFFDQLNKSFCSLNWNTSFCVII